MSLRWRPSLCSPLSPLHRKAAYYSPHILKTCGIIPSTCSEGSRAAPPQMRARACIIRLLRPICRPPAKEVPMSRSVLDNHDSLPLGRRQPPYACTAPLAPGARVGVASRRLASSHFLAPVHYPQPPDPSSTPAPRARAGVRGKLYARITATDFPVSNDWVLGRRWRRERGHECALRRLPFPASAPSPPLHSRRMLSKRQHREQEWECAASCMRASQRLTPPPPPAPTTSPPAPTPPKHTHHRAHGHNQRDLVHGR